MTLLQVWFERKPVLAAIVMIHERNWRRKKEQSLHFRRKLIQVEQFGTQSWHRKLSWRLYLPRPSKSQSGSGYCKNGQLKQGFVWTYLTSLILSRDSVLIGFGYRSLLLFWCCCFLTLSSDVCSEKGSKVGRFGKTLNESLNSGECCGLSSSQCSCYRSSSRVIGSDLFSRPSSISSCNLSWACHTRFDRVSV